jgi:hypothetical protein
MTSASHFRLKTETKILKPANEGPVVSLVGAHQSHVRMTSGKSSPSSRTSELDAFFERPRTVRFTNCVSTVEIPHREDYSFEQKQQMWNSAEAIRAMSRRNRRESCWEHENGVIEEECYCEYGGVVVHPAHLPADYDYKQDTLAVQYGCYV